MSFAPPLLKCGARLELWGCPGPVILDVEKVSVTSEQHPHSIP